MCPEKVSTVYNFLLTNVDIGIKNIAKMDKTITNKQIEVKAKCFSLNPFTNISLSPCFQKTRESRPVVGGAIDESRAI